MFVNIQIYIFLNMYWFSHVDYANVCLLGLENPVGIKKAKPEKLILDKCSGTTGTEKQQ